MDASFDAIEILNPHQSEDGNAAGLRDWREWEFIATGGSDIHNVSYTAFYPTAFSAGISNLYDLVTAIKEGNCRPVFDHPCKLVEAAAD